MPEFQFVNAEDLPPEIAQALMGQQMHAVQAEEQRLAAQLRHSAVALAPFICSCRLYFNWMANGAPPQYGCMIHSDLGALIQTLPWPYREQFGGTR